MAIEPSIYPLKGRVQHYAWGGFDYIPQLLQRPNEEQKTFAEYWLGAHPAHSSTVLVADVPIALDLFIHQYPAAVLGEKVAKEFRTLPYLLKVLDVRQMLSIQVHPNKESAVLCYENENRQGVSLSAPHRNYKDANHKPELMVALGDFWLLHGFKPAEKLIQILEAVPEFTSLIPIFEKEGYKGLYQKVMTGDQREVNKILEPVVAKIGPLYRNNELQKDDESFWAARAVATFCTNGQYDRGIFSIYFFNLLHLKKGQGIYQPAGLPHAYLEGQNVEIMANSDNVLRAGLTDKHIDVPELMKHTHFVATNPSIIEAAPNAAEIHYESPASEFDLHAYTMKEGENVAIQSTSAEIVLVLDGNVQVSARNTEIKVEKGQAVFVIADSSYGLSASEPSVIFRASVPAV